MAASIGQLMYMCSRQRRQCLRTLYWPRYSAWSYGLKLRLVHHRDALGCVREQARADFLTVRCAFTKRNTSPACGQAVLGKKASQLATMLLSQQFAAAAPAQAMSAPVQGSTSTSFELPLQDTSSRGRSWCLQRPTAASKPRDTRATCAHCLLRHTHHRSSLNQYHVDATSTPECT